MRSLGRGGRSQWRFYSKFLRSVLPAHLQQRLLPDGRPGVLVSSVFRITESFLASPHLPLDAAWDCLVGIELGTHSRVPAALEGRNQRFQGLLGPKEGRDS